MRILDIELPRHPTKRWAERAPGAAIDVFCIHHSVTPRAFPIRGIAEFHIRQGWPGIRYHYAIAADGAIYQCNADNLRTKHGNDWNTGLGVCLVGNFTALHPTEAQLASARWLLTEKRREYGPLRLVGHREAPGASTQCPGNTWLQWRDRIEEEVPVSKLGVHLQLYPPWHTRAINESSCSWVKMIDPTGPYPYSRPVNVIGRLWIGGDHVEQAYVDQREAGADRYFELCLPRYRQAPWVTVWEGPNEPAPFWDRLQNLAAFSMQWTRRMRDAGLKCAVGGLAVGRPDVGTAHVLGPAIEMAEYWHLHEYGQPTMQTDRGWLCLRYRRTVAELRAAGFRIPPLLITECGIDGGAVTPLRLHEAQPRRGWKTFATWPQYQEQLAWYASEIAKDDYVAAATPFVSAAVMDPEQGWPDFDLNEEQTRWVANFRLAGAPPALPQPPPSMSEAEIGAWLSEHMQAHVLPLNPEAALYKAAKLRNVALMPASDEEYLLPGIVCQVFRHPLDDAWQEIAWTRIGEWAPEQIRWVRRRN